VSATQKLRVTLKITLQIKTKIEGKMTFKFKNIALVSTLLLSTMVSAKEPTIGAKANGGVFVYRESVEMYWNDWTAYLLMDKKTLKMMGQAHLTLVSEGKTSEFVGNISINCENGKYFWESASNFGDALPNKKEISAVIPTQVIKNVTKLFCK